MTRKVVSNVTVQCALNSRIAVVGANGAGKSTMVKLLTGELIPDEGTAWKHPNMRVAYVAQHAFHHVEQVCQFAGSLVALSAVLAFLQL